MKNNYTYKKYLKAWRERYGDETTGVATWLHHGKKRQTTIHKLTKGQFKQSLATVKECHKLVEEDQSRPAYEWNDALQTRLLKRAFPHELRLLI